MGNISTNDINPTEIITIIIIVLKIILDLTSNKDV